MRSETFRCGLPGDCWQTEGRRALAFGPDFGLDSSFDDLLTDDVEKKMKASHGHR